MHRFKQRFVISARLFLTLLAAAGGTAHAQSNPVPLINQPLVPDAVAPGGQSFTLTVNGTGFVSGSVVQWNGVALATTYVSGSQLTATVPASDVATAGTASVTVVNPGKGVASNTVYFQFTSPTISVAFGRSDISSPAGPAGLVAGDLNADGKQDLVFTATGAPQPEVYVMLGNGDGTFGAASGYQTGGGAELVAIGDFNGDGKLDLAVANGADSTVGILLGNGDGTFGAPSTFATASQASQLIVADFNGDGELDIACVVEIGVSVLLGNGDGTFQSQRLLSAQSTGAVVTGDFNDDGKLDLALMQSISSDVMIFLGNGDGTFQAPVGFPDGLGPGVLTAADSNGDGKLDLAVDGSITGSVSVLLGNGDGTFQNYVLYPTGEIPGLAAVGDFNADGKLDLAVTSDWSSTICVLLGNGDGSFQPFLQFGTGLYPYQVAAADFNGDGNLDLASANFSSNTISVFLSEAAVNFTPASLTFLTQLIRTVSVPQTVTLTNQGSTSLGITSIAVSGTDTVDFSQTNNCGSSVPPAGTCSITVTFAPKAEGALSATVVVGTENAGNPGFLVSGIGTESSLAPASLSFGSVPVGQRSRPQQVKLTNTGRTLMLINHYEGIALVGSDHSDFAFSTACGYSLEPGQSCIISVVFTPKVQGALSAQLQVNDNGTGQFGAYQYVNLTGTGTQ